MKELVVASILLAAPAIAHAQAPDQGGAAPQPEPPQVGVVPQPDSPLRISSVRTKWAVPDRSGIELYVVVENVNGKAVSSYATRDDGGGDAGAACLLLSAHSPGKVLRPGGSEGRSTWRGYSPSSSAPPRRMVDFVEFTDGTTWGADACRSAELLAGQRAGAREARKLLTEVFATGGADAVIEALKSGLPEVEPPPDRSRRWRQGFGSGFSSYVNRIRRANEEWGFTEIEYALGRPIDALEEKVPGEKRLTPELTRRPPQATTCIAGHKVDKKYAAGGRVE